MTDGHDRVVHRFDRGWTFREGFDEAAIHGAVSGERIRLPHNAVDLPLRYFDERSFQKNFTYQKIFRLDDLAGRDAMLRFDGAMADASVRLNGVLVAQHADGYTPFEARLTPHLKAGDNLLTVRVDGSENPTIPPFGGQIDYLTYAGIYRDVWLILRPKIAIAALKIETPDPLAERKRVRVIVQIEGLGEGKATGVAKVDIRDALGALVAAREVTVEGRTVEVTFDSLAGLSLWDVDRPVLYRAVVTLSTASGVDRLEASFGFREAKFTPDGFFLNGRRLKIRGLNRHQSFPYAGYALGRRAQERDAEFLKRTLRVNLARTSHYPQSPWFLDHCDRIGLLVFEEIPGWQHIGGDLWKDRAVANVEAMVRRDWNHPSIVLWGVRINESADDHAFYQRTNAVARTLDPTRQTGGVRYIERSELLEDVYTMNDFVLGSEEQPGVNRPKIALRAPREVTGLTRDVPYMVTEFGGHMFPTKRGDHEQRQMEHVARCLQVLDAAYADDRISGAIGWCMSDYNTHKDFGSGDRICHHGVSDIFREPKFAGFVYASQGEPEDCVVLEPVTYYARGERNIGGILPLVVLTNCDEVEVRYGKSVSKRATPDRATYPHLPHPPAIFDLRLFSAEEVGLWGMTWEDGEVIGYRNGAIVARRRFVADPVATRMTISADDETLTSEEKDCTRVIVKAVDQAGNVLPFFDEPALIRVSGPARRLGPEWIAFAGGSIGFWVETTEGEGDVEIVVANARLGEARARIRVECGGRRA